MNKTKTVTFLRLLNNLRSLVFHSHLFSKSCFMAYCLSSYLQNIFFYDIVKIGIDLSADIDILVDTGF